MNVDILGISKLKWTGMGEFNSAAAAAAAKWLQSCPTLSDPMTPWTAAYQAPLSMGFSRQEHWSGLPFPSPMHESEKSK